MRHRPADTQQTDSLDAILKDIREERASPCYLLYGAEDFLIGDALDRVVAALVPAGDRDLNLTLMDGDSEDTDRLCEALLTAPLIPGRKVVVVRKTRLFQSKQTLPDLIQKIRQQAETDPARVRKDFLTLLGLTGWRLEDLREEGWRRISDAEWAAATSGDSGEKRDTWLPRMVEHCERQGLGTDPQPKGTDRLEGLLKAGLPESHHLILTAEAVDRKRRLFKAISETGRVLAFDAAKNDGRRRQLLMRAAAPLLAGSGKALSEQAWTVLGQKTGYDLHSAMAAIEKLISYVRERPTIDEADIHAVTGKTKEDRVFDLTGAILDKDLTAGLQILRTLLEQGTPPVLILNMIAREVRHLLQAKILIRTGRATALEGGADYGRFQKSLYPTLKEWANREAPPLDLMGQHPYVVYLSLKGAGAFSYRKLLGFLSRLVETDTALKTTGRDAGLLLERLVLEICS